MAIYPLVYRSGYVQSNMGYTKLLCSVAKLYWILYGIVVAC